MSFDLPSRIATLERLCLSRGHRVGVAESCTGGLLSSWICSAAGVSRWYVGGVVSYGRAVKKSVLGVPEATIAVHGEVSVPVARAMASGTRAVLGCEWAVSITGIAGPGGGTLAKPVGTVCFAVVGPGVSLVEQVAFDPSWSRGAIQAAAAEFAFEFLIRAIG